ncbi:ABC transporter G family member 14-like isoform X1 [Asterias rubens]|uniref:ABC transporter G family member 14-like isoform X1 n=2 Tax=Asterias rubens TaxID=7604 RepID=UPI0014555251|nr:ABC transporter G family member 14-like isoform X1 [Asterias rubens]XP_033641797.1 ABC transporter G family member 14-like isoform X1 [Asterias rubens]
MTKIGATLKFENIHLMVGNTSILQDVSGLAEPAQLMAVLGPSGCGKTTLLHVISGRLAEFDFGSVMINDFPLTKALRRKIALVLQDDIFFANLTIRETLMFTARLRLPSSMPYEAKERRVEEIVDTLDIRKCLDTKIGDYLKRGVSGGERKRANIACELLMDPAVLMLDEPTSGLDSTTSMMLVETLKKYAADTYKTVIMTIHQPSSQIFHLFDKLLLLVAGQAIYFGRANEALDYFGSLGLHCEPHTNPADFLMDKSKGTEDELSLLFDAAKRKTWRTTTRESRESQTPFDWIHGCHDRLPSPLDRVDLSTLSDDVPFDILGLYHPPEHQSKRGSRLSSSSEQENHARRTSVSPDRDHSKRRRSTANDPAIGSSSWGVRRNALVTLSGAIGVVGVVSSDTGGHFYSKKQLRTRKVSTSSSPDNLEKWPTTFLDQLRTLTRRNFRQSRDVFLSKFLFIKNILLAVVVGLLWFQTQHEEQRINDIRGFYFFGLVYWGFESMFMVMNAFPAERAVVNKERLSGAYRLSAYYLSKMLSELPLVLIMPSIYYIITYWMAGLNSSPLSFLASWCALLVNVLVGQSIGLTISASAPSIQEAVITVSLFMLTTLMLGGFYIEQLPVWLEWSSYLSYTFYIFTLQMHFEFGMDGNPVKCRQDNSVFDECGPSSNLTHVDSVKVLDHIALIPLPLQAICAIVVGYFVVFRILGYVVLRFIRTPG